MEKLLSLKKEVIHLKKVLIGFAALLMVCGLTFLIGRVAFRPAAGPEFLDPRTIAGVLPDEIRKMIASGNYDEDIVAILEATAARDLPASVYEKIHLAFQAGEIDRQAEALLLLQAAYAPETLPEKYRGPKYLNGKHSLQRELQWLINHYHQLDPGTQAVVLPFILPADDPGSYFHPGFENGTGLKGLSLVKTAHASGSQWSQTTATVAGATHAVTLYYREQGLPVNKQLEIELQVYEIMEALNEAWPRFMGLLGANLSSDLHLYLTNQLAGDTQGDALYLEVNGVPRYEIRINESQIGDDLKSVVAHELFHCFQFEMGLTWYGECSDLFWLIEATAVWAEHFVYPATNLEHLYLEWFFYTLPGDRLVFNGVREYASYMLFYFLGESLGRRDYVPTILWAATAQKDTKDIRGMLMGQIQDLKETYGKFALYNWNLPPAKFYTDTPSFPAPGRVDPKLCNPTQGSGDSPSMHYYRLQTREEGDYAGFLDPGGTFYMVFHFDAPPEEIEKVRFDFRQEDSDLQWVKRQALIRIGDTWLTDPEDWTDLEYRDFCRKLPEENVTIVVVILSNAGLKPADHAIDAFVVDTRDKCADLKGYVRMTYEQPQIIESEKVTTIDRAEFYSEDELVYCPEDICYISRKHHHYVSRKRYINYEGFYYYKNVYIAESGDLLGMYEYTREDSGRLSEEYELEEKFVRLFLHKDGKTVRLSLTYIRADDWITVVETWEEESFGVPSRREEITKTNKWKDFANVWTDDFEIGSKSSTWMGTVTNETCEITDDYIAGTRTIQNPHGGVATLEFKFIIINPLAVTIEIIEP